MDPLWIHGGGPMDGPVEDGGWVGWLYPSVGHPGRYIPGYTMICPVRPPVHGPGYPVTAAVTPRPAE